VLGAQVGNNKRQSTDNNLLPGSVQPTRDRVEGVVNDTSSALVVREKPTGVPPLPPVYVSPRKEVKRPKKGYGNRGALFQQPAATEVTVSKETGGEEDKTFGNAGLAGSFEECRRAQ
jgi:hypothetical protein